MPDGKREASEELLEIERRRGQVVFEGVDLHEVVLSTASDLLLQLSILFHQNNRLNKKKKKANHSQNDEAYLSSRRRKRDGINRFSLCYDLSSQINLGLLCFPNLWWR